MRTATFLMTAALAAAGAQAQSAPIAPVPVQDDAATRATEVRVFFDWDHSDLGPAARDLLDAALAQAPAPAQVTAVLEGHVDVATSREYAIGLSDRMARSVRDYLAAQGVPAANISWTAYGAERPLVGTERGVREPLNRRVDVRLSW